MPNNDMLLKRAQRWAVHTSNRPVVAVLCTECKNARAKDDVTLTYTSFARLAASLLRRLSSWHPLHFVLSVLLPSFFSSSSSCSVSFLVPALHEEDDDEPSPQTLLPLLQEKEVVVVELLYAFHGAAVVCASFSHREI